VHRPVLLALVGSCQKIKAFFFQKRLRRRIAHPGALKKSAPTFIILSLVGSCQKIKAFLCKNKRLGLNFFLCSLSAKELCILAKQPCILAKEPCNPSLGKNKRLELNPFLCSFENSL